MGLSGAEYEEERQRREEERKQQFEREQAEIEAEHNRGAEIIKEAKPRSSASLRTLRPP